MLDHVIDNIESTYIAPSAIHGYGLFCDRGILAETVLTVLDGQVIPWSVHEKLNLAEEWNSLAGDRILVRPYRTKYYYINHSRAPNAKVRRQRNGVVEVYTTRDLEAYEEISLDYRDEPLPENYLKGHGATYL